MSESVQQIVVEKTPQKENELRKILISKIETHSKEQLSYRKHKKDLPSLKSTARGMLHEVLAAKELRGEKEVIPEETELINTLQNPKKYRLDTTDIPRNPDLILVEFDRESGAFIIKAAYEGKTKPVLDVRACIQLSDAGTLKGIQNLCQIINESTPEELRNKKLFIIADAKEKLIKEKGESAKLFRISDNFEIHLVLTSGSENPTIKIGNHQPHEDEQKAIEEVKQKLVDKKIKVYRTQYSFEELFTIAEDLLNRYQLPDEYKGLYKEFNTPTSSPRR